jgi:hypothetical protein
MKDFETIDNMEAQIIKSVTSLMYDPILITSSLGKYVKSCYIGLAFHSI